MPKPTVIVDRIQSLDRPDHPLAVAPSANIPGHVVVHLMGGASLLDLHDPRAAIWEGLLDELRQAREPVYLETDPDTHVIQQLLYPRSVVVTHVATAPVGNRHEVAWEISQARHHLDTANPDYPHLLEALTTACRQGTPVLVTETVVDQQIIDVRPDPAPFAGGPAILALPSVGPLDDAALAARAVTPQRARKLFRLVAEQPHIPFTYPDDGCWGRAHEMVRLIRAEGGRPRKVWIYGDLMVTTRNHPRCSVRWGWHVAPTLAVKKGERAEIHVLDPSLFPDPVPQVTWAGVQHDGNASLHDTDASVFYRSASGTVTLDPTYSETAQVLARYRRELALRTAHFGPPPYCNCP